MDFFADLAAVDRILRPDVTNAFCPTGPEGGQDNSCGRGGRRSGKKAREAQKAREVEERERVMAEQFRLMARGSRSSASAQPAAANPTPPAPRTARSGSSQDSGRYPDLKTSGRSGAKGLPDPHEAARSVPSAEVDEFMAAARRRAERGRAHLHQVAEELGWDESRLAYVAAAAYGRGLAPLRAYEGGLTGLTDKESRWSFEHQGDRLGQVLVGNAVGLEERFLEETLADAWFVRNVFCKTGEGGGVKPDCRKGQGGATSGLPPLGKEAQAVVDKVRDSASVHEGAILKTLGKMFDLDPAEIRQGLKDAWEKAEVTVNLPPAEAGQILSRDRHLRNLFELEPGAGMGETDHDVRRGFERSAFGASVDAVPAEDRPKYGAVNWGRDPDGAAPHYGDSVLVLNKDALRRRMTLAPEDTCDAKGHQLGTGSSPINALARHALALKEAGVDARTGKNADGMSPVDLWGSYVEVQVWGKLPISKETVSEIRLRRVSEKTSGNAQVDNHRRRARAGNEALERMAREIGIPVSYYGGE